MTISRVTGIPLIVIPIAFNLLFFLLQKRFEYPYILRKPTDHILQRFRATRAWPSANAWGTSLPACGRF
jgi:hypothetical protein